MEITLIIGIVVVILALAFAFSNGFNDSASIVATVISTRALSPGKAILLASIFEFIGACFLGTAVAKTIGKGIIDPNIFVADKYSIIIIVATLLGATSWNVICTILGFPISASHALIGGFVGAGIIAGGVSIIQWDNVLKICLVLIIAPAAGLFFSLIATKILYFLSRGATPKINKLYKTLQIWSSMAFAVSHGSNASQKPMGIITFSLIILSLYAPTGETFVPKWVIIACAIGMSVGVATGGRKVMKTIGMSIYKIKPINGFAASGAGALAIYLASVMGLPVSSTQVISCSVIGTGAAERPKAVRWGVSFDIFMVWLITIPSTAIVSGIIYFLLLNSVKLLGL